MTDQLKGYWQNGENQDVEVRNYGRKWNYWHMFENHVRHAHMKKTTYFTLDGLVLKIKKSINQIIIMGVYMGK